mmetsp:Transcript_81630/g.228947  ORF Transcript_81630/g.228947 Transcript_81630/m.228947 type:complete len:244 (+) Transcript_81630:2521-3252(+)
MFSAFRLSSESVLILLRERSKTSRTGNKPKGGIPSILLPERYNSLSRGSWINGVSVNLLFRIRKMRKLRNQVMSFELSFGSFAQMMLFSKTAFVKSLSSRFNECSLSTRTYLSPVARSPPFFSGRAHWKSLGLNVDSLKRLSEKSKCKWAFRSQSGPKQPSSTKETMTCTSNSLIPPSACSTVCSPFCAWQPPKTRWRSDAMSRLSDCGPRPPPTRLSPPPRSRAGRRPRTIRRPAGGAWALG